MRSSAEDVIASYEAPVKTVDALMRQTIEVLKQFGLEQEEPGTGPKNLLQKGERARIKDFKAMIKAVQLRQEGRQDEVGKILDESWERTKK